MPKRYVVESQKSIQGNDGKTVFTAGTIVRHDQICRNDGKLDPGAIRDGFIRLLDDRPSEEEEEAILRSREIDAAVSGGASTDDLVPVFENPEEIQDATLEELRAFADEHFGLGAGEFQPEHAEEVRERLLGLKKKPTVDSRPGAEG